MSEVQRWPTGSLEHELHAYHDGELRGWARWRFERRLRRSPELRRELAELVRLGERIREIHPPPAPPDLWAGIEARLPAIDARRREVAEAPRRTLSTAWLLGPVGAAAAAALATLAIFAGLGERPAAAGGAVRWLDSGGRNIIVLEDDGESQATILWLLDGGGEAAVRGRAMEAGGWAAARGGAIEVA